jgi:hypothetical protein
MALNPPRRVNLRRIREQQQRHHHRRLIRRPTMPIRAIRPVERRQVQLRDALQHKPRQMILRQPIPQRAQSKKFCGIPGIPIPPPDRTLCATPSMRWGTLACWPGELKRGIRRARARMHLHEWSDQDADPAFGEEESSRGARLRANATSTPMPTGPEPGLWIVAIGVASPAPVVTMPFAECDRCWLARMEPVRDARRRSGPGDTRAAPPHG